MIRVFKIIRGLIKLKNAQVSRFRERIAGLEETNRILSAYLALLIEEKGEVLVPRELIASSVDGYRSEVGVVGDNYRIKVLRAPEKKSDGKK